MHPDALWLGGPGGDSRCTANHAGYAGRSAHDTLALRLCWGSSHRCGQITMDLPGEPADVSGGRIRVSRQCSASAKHLWHHMPRDRGAHVRSGLGGAWRRQPMHGQPRWVRGRVRTRHAGSAGIPPTSSGQFAAPRPTEDGMIPAVLQPLGMLVKRRIGKIRSPHDDRRRRNLSHGGWGLRGASIFTGGVCRQAENYQRRVCETGRLPQV